MAIMMITRLIKILKVNSTSSKTAGKGTTSIAIINNTRNGIPSPENSNFDRRCRIVDMVKVDIYLKFCEINELMVWAWIKIISHDKL